MVCIRIGSYASPGHLKTRPFEIRTFCPDFSLDRFIKKRVIKNILFMQKWSRLAEENVRSGFQMVKRWPTIQKPDFLSGFEW